MRRDGEEASLHRGRGEERRSADRRQSHGTATGTQSTYDHRSRGKILYRVIFFFFFSQHFKKNRRDFEWKFLSFSKIRTYFKTSQKLYLFYSSMSNLLFLLF